MLADAIIRTRAGIGATDGQLSVRKPDPATTLPFNSAYVFNRWDPNVRFYVLLSELMSGMTFEPSEEKEIIVSADCKGKLKLITLTQPSAVVLKGQCKLVQSWSELRNDRLTEIMSEMAPQVAYWSSMLNLQPQRHKWTMELLNLALGVAAITSFRIKHVLAIPRPSAFSPDIQPIIAVPEHGSLPSGHATEAYAAANILSALAGRCDRNAHTRLFTQASRIAINRTIAGVHFPMDSEAGKMVGTAVAEMLLTKADALKRWNPRTFVNTKEDFDFPQSADSGHSYVVDTAENLEEDSTLPPPGTPQVPLVKWLWRKAKAEWA